MTDTAQLVIIHPHPERVGFVCMTTPVDNGFPIEEIAAAVVPAGQPYLIVDRSDLPPDDGFWFNAWQADFSEPDGYGVEGDWATLHPTQNSDDF